MLSLIDRRVLLETKKKATENFLFEIRIGNITNRPATRCEILLVKNSASNDQIKKHYYNISLLTQLDAGGDAKFFRTNNQAYQKLTNDAAQEMYNRFGLH